MKTPVKHYSSDCSAAKTLAKTPNVRIISIKLKTQVLWLGHVFNYI